MTILEIPASDYESALSPGAQLVDVREPAEVASGTLPGAQNVPLGELAARVGELDPSRRVVLLCRSGARSGRAAEYLETLGFDDLVNLSGGIGAAAAGADGASGRTAATYTELEAIRLARIGQWAADVAP